ACASLSDWKVIPVSLVTPSTRLAISSPERSRTSSRLADVSSTVSCRRAAHSVSVSSRRPAQILATPTGWVMKSSPDLRRWSAWCSQAKTNASWTRARSTSTIESAACSSTIANRSPSRRRSSSVRFVASIGAWSSGWATRAPGAAVELAELQLGEGTQRGARDGGRTGRGQRFVQRRAVAQRAVEGGQGGAQLAVALGDARGVGALGLPPREVHGALAREGLEGGALHPGRRRVDRDDVRVLVRERRRTLERAPRAQGEAAEQPGQLAPSDAGVGGHDEHRLTRRDHGGDGAGDATVAPVADGAAGA